MAAASLQRTCMSNPTMSRDEGRRLVQLDVVLWIEGNGAGLSIGTWDSAIPDGLASVAEPVKIACMVAINEN